MMFNQLETYISFIPSGTDSSDVIDYRSVYIKTKELDDKIYPLSVQEIAKKQCRDKTSCKHFTKDSDNDKFSVPMINYKEVLV